MGLLLDINILLKIPGSGSIIQAIASTSWMVVSKVVSECMNAREKWVEKCLWKPLLDFVLEVEKYYDLGFY